MIVAGFGFRTAATAGSLANALSKAQGIHHPHAIATATDKAETEIFRTFATEINLPVIKVSPDALPEQATLTHSTHSQNTRATGSLSEAAALAAAGPQSKLLTPRVISDDHLATCALAMGDDT